MPVLRLRRERYLELCDARGWRTQGEQAEKLGVHIAVTQRMHAREDYAPGEQTIAKILAAFPEVGFDDLFELVSEEVAS